MKTETRISEVDKFIIELYGYSYPASAEANIGNLRNGFNEGQIRMKKNLLPVLLKLVDSYWKFDDNQQPRSSWHDKQDLKSEIEKLLTLNPNPHELY